ncbi:MAG: 30S ribosomal protein S3 [Deltaproteobacteria bacterium RIFCSPLOWO2_02_FULL_46_8]|nr:MAG: 30S ribosomal protein S3 [Deltaproteobacteria bacterium RIFCSPLOWO2_02_FULL_46_8]
MGQKTHPKGFRLGIIRSWDSKWYVKPKEYPRLVREDHTIRKYLKEKLYGAGISLIEIERASDNVTINIYTARPGLVIGKKGAGIEQLKQEVSRFTKDAVTVNIREVRRAELDAQLVAENVAMQLERRIAFRRAMKKAVQATLKFGGKGIKIQCSGRLAGAELARTEWYHEGSVPLHTLRADIDYGFAEAKTTYGIIGVKTWIYKGEVLPT